MSFLSRPKLDSPAVAAVRAASVDLAPSLGLTKVQEDAILNQGLAGRVQAVIAPDTPLALLQLLAHDPSKYVIGAFFGQYGPSRPDRFANFDDCFPPGLIPELWSALKPIQQYGILAARATYLRGTNPNNHVSYVFLGAISANPFADYVPPIAGKYQVTAQDWQLWYKLRLAPSSIGSTTHKHPRPAEKIFWSALDASDPEVRIAAANHPWCPYPLLDVLTQDATPIVADAAINQLAAADGSEYYVKSGRNHPLFNMDLLADNDLSQPHCKTLAEIEPTREPSEETASIEVGL
jgi:hypothetical protein